jgi:hypothetical protein
MSKSKFAEDQIKGFFWQAEADLAVAEICRKGGSSAYIPCCGSA